MTDPHTILDEARMIAAADDGLEPRAAFPSMMAGSLDQAEHAADASRRPVTTLHNGAPVTIWPKGMKPA